jgi:hypothetical protein
MQKQARKDFRIFRGWAGALILRPWFDRVGVRAVADWYLPLSRAWAAGVAAQGDVDAFREALGLDAAALPRAAKILTRLDHRRRRGDEANAQWEDALFGSVDPGPRALEAAENRRLERSVACMVTRGSFLPVRRKVQKIAWKVDSPAAVQAAHGHRLAGPSVAFPPPPPDTIVDISRGIARNGRMESWLRMTSPVLGDTAWARVFRPADGPVHGAIVSLHGVFMEQDAWTMADPVTDLVDRGFCVIRPEGPWHGRRCPPGTYGGELVFAEGLLGFIRTFEAWAAEVALFTRWAHAHISPRVAVAGISLGALTAQLVVTACRYWPADMRPDAALLIATTDDIVDGALNGSLARAVGMVEHLWMAGWTRDEVRRWAPLIEPAAAPAIDPSGIVMALGDVDTVTPFASGRAFADRWKIPAENMFVAHRGHFTTALGLYRDPAPLLRLAELLETWP